MMRSPRTEQFLKNSPPPGEKVISSGHGQSGFTLLEIMVAIFILGAMMTAVYGFVISTVRVKDRIESQADGLATGPAIVSLLASDLRCAYGYDIAGMSCFEGVDNSIGAEQSADSIHFISSKNSRSADDEIDVAASSDLTEVSYVLRQSPEDPRFLELFRREEFFVDEAVDGGGKYRKLADRIVSFDLLYFGGGTDMEEEPEGEESWSSANQSRLPKAVRLRMEVADPYDGDPELEPLPRIFEKLINLAPGLHMNSSELEPLLAAMHTELESDTDEEGGAGGQGTRQGGRGGRGGRNNGQQGRGGRRGGRNGNDAGGLFGGGNNRGGNRGGNQGGGTNRR